MSCASMLTDMIQLSEDLVDFLFVLCELKELVRIEVEGHGVGSTLIVGERTEVSTNGDNDVNRVRGNLVSLSADERGVADPLVQSSSPLSILSLQAPAITFDDNDLLKLTIADAADGEVGLIALA